ncbi:MAG: type VI secretion system tube protein Hcp [Rubrivivax sp.]|nr:type VI secretion system tube protein Hcp [Rubrivivax sp.]
MPIAPQGTPGSGACDIFLHVMAKRAGKVKGEARSAGHTDDIVVSGWRWGLSVSSSVGMTRETSLRSYNALTVFKSIDSATTALMSALASNDEIKEAKLTMRRAGGEQEDFFLITLKDARIASVNHEVDADGETREIVAISFTQVEVEYRGQRATGGRGASSIFADNLPART